MVVCQYGTDKKETSMSVPNTFFYSQCLATQARSSTMSRHFDKTFCCFFSVRTILDFFNSMLSVPSNYQYLAQLVSISIAISKIKLKQLSILHHSSPLKQTTLTLNKSPLFNLMAPFQCKIEKSMVITFLNFKLKLTFPVCQPNVHSLLQVKFGKCQNSQGFAYILS